MSQYSGISFKYSTCGTLTEAPLSGLPDNEYMPFFISDFYFRLALLSQKCEFSF